MLDQAVGEMHIPVPLAFAICYLAGYASRVILEGALARYRRARR